MPRVIEGELGGAEARVAVVAARFNDAIVDRLVDGCLGVLRRHGVPDDATTLVRVPGAFEIPPVARRLAGRSDVDAVVCLGAVIRGDTPHFEYISGEAARGIGRAGYDTGTPVIFGVLTCDTVEQAIERSGTKAGNKGAEAALAALEMVGVLRALDGEGG